MPRLVTEKDNLQKAKKNPVDTSSEKAKKGVKEFYSLTEEDLYVKGQTLVLVGSHAKAVSVLCYFLKKFPEHPLADNSAILGEN